MANHARCLNRRLRGAALALSVSAVVAGCGGGSSGGTPAARSESSAPTPSATRPACPNPDGGQCLGDLEAGDYSTVDLIPGLSYAVPDGYSNLEDLTGNFILVPTGQTVDTVNNGSSDFIGVYGSVVPAADCDSAAPQNFVNTVPNFAKWLASTAGFAISKRHAVTIGGLTGVVLDLRIAKGYAKSCPYSNGRPTRPLMAGINPSGLEHGLDPGVVDRLYLLTNRSNVLAIEVMDVKDAGHLDQYSSMVQAFKFNQ
jgi:hypothetical protein